MPYIPPDVVDAVLAWCDKDTLIAAAQVTSDAERYFYKFLHVYSTECGRKLVAALKSPKRGEQRSVAVRDVRLFQLTDQNICTSLLQLLPRLERLNVVNWCGGFTLPPEPNGGFRCQLRRLRIFKECDRLLPEQFVTFLEGQNELEMLELVWSESPQRSALLCARARDTGGPLFLPKLRTLLASEEMILAFLSQNRPLLQDIRVRAKNHLLVHGSLGPADVPSLALFAAIKSFAGNLLSLTVGTNDVAQTIRLLADACPCLHTLKVVFDCTGAFKRFRDVFEIRDFGQKIALPDIPTLRKLVLHPVGMTLEEDSEGRGLELGFQFVIYPGICGVMPKLQVLGLHAYAGPVSNPTVLFPAHEMGRPSASVPDWDQFHEKFEDQEFFCDD